MRKTNKNLPITILENSNVPSYEGGAYCTTFVYSNKGNFVVKGYYKETKKYLLELRERNYKYFCNIVLHNGFRSRNMWMFYKDNYVIYECKKPSTGEYRNNSQRHSRRWLIQSKDTTNTYTIYVTIFSFKRKPNSWLNIFNTL